MTECTKQVLRRERAAPAGNRRARLATVFQGMICIFEAENYLPWLR